MINKHLRWAFRHPRKALLRSLRWPYANRSFQQGHPPAAPPPPGQLRSGLTIIGYLRSEIGLGQAARNLVYAADSVRLPVSMRHLPLPGRENDMEFASKCNQTADRLASMLVIGLASICDLQTEIGPGRFNILYPFWELTRIPEEWIKVARQFDEVWAPSRFIASAFEACLDKPVQLLRQPVRLPQVMPASRSDRQELRFFTFFDFDSSGARKNPQAAVLAFRAAFSPQQKDVELIIKTRGGGDKGLRKWLLKIAASDRRIKLIDRTLNRAAMDALMAMSDVFVSLHRSEGFGFGAAEALAAGKVVVATDFGGTTDFINVHTGYPIEYCLQPVEKGEYPAGEGQTWANAKQDAVIDAFRSIYEQFDEAAVRTSRGFAMLKENHSSAAVGAEMAKLLADRGLIELPRKPDL